MKKLLYLLVLMALVSCNKDRDSLKGVWNVSQYNIATGNAIIYQVTISKEQSSDYYRIYNFHNAGDDVDTYARFTELEDGTLELLEEPVGGIGGTPSGTGTVSGNYEQITWEYKYIDGSANNEYGAVYK